MDRRWLIAGGLILVLVGSASAYFWFREDPRIVQVRGLADQLFTENREQLSDDQRRELFSQLRDATRDLSDDQRRVLEEDREKRFEKQLDEFFALPKDQQIAYLDQRIDRMIEWQKNREARRAQQIGRAHV